MASPASADTLSEFVPGLVRAFVLAAAFDPVTVDVLSVSLTTLGLGGLNDAPDPDVLVLSVLLELTSDGVLDHAGPVPFPVPLPLADCASDGALCRRSNSTFAFACPPPAFFPPPPNAGG